MRSLTAGKAVLAPLPGIFGTNKRFNSRTEGSDGRQQRACCCGRYAQVRGTPHPSPLYSIRTNLSVVFFVVPFLSTQEFVREACNDQDHSGPIRKDGSELDETMVEVTHIAVHDADPKPGDYV